MAAAAWNRQAANAPGELPVLPMLPPLRILLVEDDATVAEVIAGLLRGRGHDVVHVLHGLGALSEIATDGFDVGLLDLDLPALDGTAIARQLRTMGYELPLVAVTARSDAYAETQVPAAGFDGFLRKPVTGDMLVTAIARRAQNDKPPFECASAGRERRDFRFTMPTPVVRESSEAA